MIRVALLSGWHVHARDYARQALENEHVQIVKVWDEDASRGSAWAQELGVGFEENLEDCLTSPDVDAVIISTPTVLHKEVIIRAAFHRKHIFTEKVLAFTRQDCEEIFQAVDRAGVKLMLSLPRLSDGYYVQAQSIVDDGLLGRLNTIRCRLAHNGSVSTAENPNGWLPSAFYDAQDCGGGAFVDLGAHPIYLTNRLGGRPRSVSAKLGGILDLPVDDQSVAVVQYESGALGIMEAGFSSGGSPFLLELHGTHGSFMVEDERTRLKCERTNFEWEDLTDKCANLATPMEQWVKWIEQSIAPSIHRADMLLLTVINEAAKWSSESGRVIVLDS